MNEYDYYDEDVDDEDDVLFVVTFSPSISQVELIFFLYSVLLWYVSNYFYFLLRVGSPVLQNTPAKINSFLKAKYK